MTMPSLQALYCTVVLFKPVTDKSNISLQKLLELMNTVFTSCLLFLEYIDIYFQDVAENTDTLFFANNVGKRKF